MIDFKFLLYRVVLPEQLEQLRPKLMTEYKRLLHWGKAKGLIDRPKAPPITVTLRASAFQDCATLTRIVWVFNHFEELLALKELNGGHLNVGSHSKPSSVASGVGNFSVGDTTLMVAHEKIQQQHNQVEEGSYSKDEQEKGFQDSLDFATHHIHWVEGLDVEFEELVKDLNDLIDGLKDNSPENQIQSSTSE